MATHARDQPEFAELYVARLAAVIYDEGRLVPAGTIGTMVHRHVGADAYEVEFAGPHPFVITLRGSDLANGA